MHVLRLVQRAVSDWLDPSYDRIRGRGLLAREPIRRYVPEPVVAYKVKKGPEPYVHVGQLLERGMRYVDEWAQPGGAKPPAAPGPRGRRWGRDEGRGPSGGRQARLARSRRCCGGEARRSSAGCPREYLQIGGGLSGRVRAH